MDPFVLKTLRRLRKEAPKRFKSLRDICDELIVALCEKEKANGNESLDTDGDKYFEPLETACDTRQPKLMEIALDALHFLIEHGYLRGKSKVNVFQDAGIGGDLESKSSQRALIDVVVETITKCSDEFDDAVQLQVIKVLLTTITSLHCDVHESSLLLAVRACFHIHLISKNLVNKTTAKAALTQMLSVINQRMELHHIRLANENVANLSHENITSNDNKKRGLTSIFESDEVKEEENVEVEVVVDNSTKVTTTNIAFLSVYHKDSYLLFRALCKLSMKGLSDEASNGAQNDAIALQNKILSLELILNILQNSGPAFRTGDKFIYAIRQYLCVSLLTNCTSQVAQITGLSLQIFVVVMANFKDHLKSELEVFVSTIFLKILESENSTYDHKCRVLEVFQNICRDPSALVELFINYDCDLEAINLFSRFVAGFAKIAKNPSLAVPNRVNVDFLASTVRKSQLEEQHIRTLGLEGLIIIIKSLGASSGLGNVSSKLKIIGTVDELIVDKSRQLISESEHFAKFGDDFRNLEDEIMESGEVNIGTGSNSSMNIVEVFDKKQKIQEEIETGILKFNLSAKKGLAYLSGLGHIELTPKGVADFFRQYQDRLDKTAVGDYLGREREYEGGFCLRVLHEYVQSMDFTDMAFDMAIRFFLGGFRLPGEAQKIDRLMEKFAERYYLQNRDSFASADMAFILAFSTIMLQTDLHNPSIRDDKRMTKEQFIKQNKGISPDGELSDEMLSDIYDRIAAEPISITADDKSVKKPKKDEQNSFVMFQATTDRRKKDAFNTERKEMVRAGEAMIKLNSRRGSVFVRNSALSDEAYVRPMFDVVWPSVLGVLSQILETYDDSQMVQLCLSGFQHCILLSCRLDFPIARHTFINALAKFTTLDTIREMHEKNVLCIKLLLSVALSEGDFLEESWTQILQSISQLARLQLLANGSHTDDVFFSDSMSTASNGNSSDGSKSFRKSGGLVRINSVNQEKVFDPFTKLFMGPSRAEATRLIEETNSDLILREIDPVLVDRVYLNSITLTGDSVRHFVRSLCAVSLLEISTSSSMNSLRGKDSSTDSSTPRIFSMQKLVEVADFNMHSRSRLDWSSIWAQLAQHFSNVGLNDNEALAMYAIDSLKQLSIKFLQKDELSNFNFQRLFLKPFETIMSKSRSITTKDLVLRCIDIMIRACAANIHSGWRSIFVIFEVAAAQDAKEIATISFDIVEQLMNSQFELLIYDFVELMNCLVAFVSSVHTTLSLKALSYLATCADHLADGHVTPAIESQNMFPTTAVSGNTTVPIEGSVADEESSVFRLWWPLLLGLSTAVADNRLLVRVKALDTLQSVLQKNGHLFSSQTWSVIFKGVLFPMIDSAKTDNTVQPRSAWPTENPPPSQNRLSWIGTMSSSALSVCVELFHLFKENTVHILPDLITMLEDCISQDIESLAVKGLKVFRDLVATLVQQLEYGPFNNADLVCSRVTTCMMKNLCLYFGEAGFVSFNHPEIPLVVRNILKDCPLSSRRKSKEMSLSGAVGWASCALSPCVVGDCVLTPYGRATVIELIPPLPGLKLSARHHLKLPWGSLYANDSTKFPLVDEIRISELRSSVHVVVTEQSWTQFISSAMTTMVVTLEFIRLCGEIIFQQKQTDLFLWRHYESFFIALETYHWHAFSFNSNIPLRLNLHQKGFMNKNRSLTNLSITLPDLLDQEVLSMELILNLVFRLHRVELVTDKLEKLEEHDKIHSWMKRLSCLALNRYLAFEEELLRKQGDDDSSDDDIEQPSEMLKLDGFARQRHEAYKSSALIVLSSILEFSPKVFLRNVNWVVPLLSRLIICESIEIRLCVRQINFTFVNPIMLN